MKYNSSGQNIVEYGLKRRNTVIAGIGLPHALVNTSPQLQSALNDQARAAKLIFEERRMASNPRQRKTLELIHAEIVRLIEDGKVQMWLRYAVTQKSPWVQKMLEATEKARTRNARPTQLTARLTRAGIRNVRPVLLAKEIMTLDNRIPAEDAHQISSLLERKLAKAIKAATTNTFSPQDAELAARELSGLLTGEIISGITSAERKYDYLPTLAKAVEDYLAVRSAITQKIITTRLRNRRALAPKS